MIIQRGIDISTESILISVIILMWICTGVFYGAYSLFRFDTMTPGQMLFRVSAWPLAVAWDLLLYIRARNRIIYKLKAVFPPRRHDEFWFMSLTELRDLEENLFRKTDLRTSRNTKSLGTTSSGYRSLLRPLENGAAREVEVPQELLFGRITPSPSKLNNGRFWYDPKDHTADSIGFAC